jgi:transposase-like protein
LLRIHSAIRESKNDGLLPGHTRPRSLKYLNTLIEQDHRGIKSRTGPMFGSKSFASAAITTAGAELIRRSHKAQFSLSRLLFKIKLRL